MILEQIVSLLRETNERLERLERKVDALTKPRIIYSCSAAARAFRVEKKVK